MYALKAMLTQVFKVLFLKMHSSVLIKILSMEQYVKPTAILSIPLVCTVYS